MDGQVSAVDVLKSILREYVKNKFRVYMLSTANCHFHKKLAREKLPHLYSGFAK